MIYQRLPEYLGVEIFKFIVDELYNGFYFRSLEINRQLDETNYNKKYEMATFYGNYNRRVRINGYDLARIKKKNGNHRYYLSTETRTLTCEGCGYSDCRSSGCRGGYTSEITYKSKYISKSLNDAVFQLYYTELCSDIGDNRITLPDPTLCIQHASPVVNTNGGW